MITDEYESRDSQAGWLNPVIEWTKNAAEDEGWVYIGDGGSRLVVKIPVSACEGYSGPPLVLKLPIFRDSWEDGRYQNASEANLWEEAPNDVRCLLTPTLASGELYRWLLMPYAEDPDEDVVKSKASDLVNQRGFLTNEVAFLDNWGVWRGEHRLIDYGHIISSYVLDEAERVSVEEYAPELHEPYEEDGEDESEEVSDGGVVDSDVPNAEQVVLYSSDVGPSEKDDVRAVLFACNVMAGEVLTLGGKEVEVVSTKPSTDTAFGAEEVAITDETRIRFD